MAEIANCVLQKMVDELVSFKKVLKEADKRKIQCVGIEGIVLKPGNIDVLLKVVQDQLENQDFDLEIKEDLKLHNDVFLDIEKLKEQGAQETEAKKDEKNQSDFQ